MRTKCETNGVTVNAYAGTTGVMLAMNIDESQRRGLLGFAIEKRKDHSDPYWLSGALNFPGTSHKPGKLIPSNQAPFQKFRWSDYGVYPDMEYTYTIHPVYGTPGQLAVLDGPEITVKTENLDAGEHQVVFNRAAASSQAFSSRFSNYISRYENARKHGEEPPPMPPEALAWLTRGLLDKILSFIGRAADQNWGLDIAIYEYELEAIVHAVKAAAERGARVRVVYHAKPRDRQTDINEENLSSIPDESKRARITNKICHHKFIVLSKRNGQEYEPQAVLCGSTNFTENGVYRQANVVHVTENRDIARQYEALFKVIFDGGDVRATRKYIDQTNLFGEPVPVFAGFSPRSKFLDLNHFIEAINAAKTDILFCTAFRLYEPLGQALLGKPHDPILRYGLQNTRSTITGFHADRTANFSAAATLPTGLEGWLKETTVGQRGNILIHTKIVIVDFTSDSPLVISGSHNLSKPASEANDENFLMLRGVPGVADTYGCELMRLYEHYRFRYRRVQDAKSKIQAESMQAKPLDLCPDDSWADEYFAQDQNGRDTLKTLDRKRFSGEMVESVPAD